MRWLPAANCTSPPRGVPAAGTWNCAAAHALYKVDLDAHLGRVIVELDRFTSSVNTAEEFARKLRANVTALSTDMAAINGRLADAVFAQVYFS